MLKTASSGSKNGTQVGDNSAGGEFESVGNAEFEAMFGGAVPVAVPGSVAAGGGGAAGGDGDATAAATALCGGGGGGGGDVSDGYIAVIRDFPTLADGSDGPAQCHNAKQKQSQKSGQMLVPGSGSETGRRRRR